MEWDSSCKGGGQQLLAASWTGCLAGMPKVGSSFLFQSGCMHHIEESHSTNYFSHVYAAFKCLSYIQADQGGPTQQGDGKSKDFRSKDLLKGSLLFALFVIRDFNPGLKNLPILTLRRGKPAIGTERWPRSDKVFEPESICKCQIPFSYLVILNILGPDI